MATRLSGAWPHVRAGLILFHLLAVITLSLPGRGFRNPRVWQRRVVKTDLADWSRTLGVRPDALAKSLQSIAAGWSKTRAHLAKPFLRYASYAAMTQSWAMFASPQRNPAELHVSGDAGSGMVPLYRPQDESAQFLASFLDHNRVRKFRGRFGRRTPGKSFNAFAAYIAKRACRERADLLRVEVALWIYRSLPPEARERGEVPEGAYENQRLYECEALR